MNKNQNKVTFAINEELIKVYRYFSSSRKDEVGEIERSLIVSTKRIIAESTTEKGFTREEFPVDAIDRLDAWRPKGRGSDRTATSSSRRDWTRRARAPRRRTTSVPDRWRAS